jgi:5'-deoxynucleotidase YfbR-like HD superfamily hydrolase
MRDDGAPFGRRQVRVLVNDVEERFVNFADVVKESDALDDLLFMFVEISGIRDDERVHGDASDMRASLSVVRVDGIEKGFHACRRKPFGGFATAPFSE